MYDPSKVAEAEGNSYKWIEQHYGIKLNTFKKKVCDILQVVFRGIYNGPHGKKEDWQEDDKFVFITCNRILSTYDFDNLTALVLLAHYYGVRVGIEPCNMQYIKISFHDRPSRVGEVWEKHPDIFKAIKRHTPEVLDMDEAKHDI